MFAVFVTRRRRRRSKEIREGDCRLVRRDHRTKINAPTQFFRRDSQRVRRKYSYRFPRPKDNGQKRRDQDGISKGRKKGKKKWAAATDRSRAFSSGPLPTTTTTTATTIARTVTRWRPRFDVLAVDGRSTRSVLTRQARCDRAARPPASRFCAFWRCCWQPRRPSAGVWRARSRLRPRPRRIRDVTRPPRTASAVRSAVDTIPTHGSADPWSWPRRRRMRRLLKSIGGPSGHQRPSATSVRQSVTVVYKCWWTCSATRLASCSSVVPWTRPPPDASTRPRPQTRNPWRALVGRANSTATVASATRAPTNVVRATG